MSRESKIEELRRQILVAEENLEAAKKTLFDLTKDIVPESSQEYATENLTSRVSAEGTVIEGIFNGENMIGPNNKIYPVPANYASKSKLVEGDGLKLTILDDGSFVFKQIAPVKRISLKGVLKFEENAYHVLANGQSYQVLFASVSYHKGKPGDKVSIVVPAEKNSKWAAFESILHDHDVLAEGQQESVIKNETSVELPENNFTSLDPNVVQAEAEKSQSEAPAPLETPIAQNEGGATTSNLKDALGIENIDINPISKSDTPKAVNPAEIPASNSRDRTVIQPPQGSTTVPKTETLSRISEMDI